jgi:Lon-like ATP-dependent protease
LENLSRNNPKGYLATFLRKKSPAGVSEGGIILPSPEIITSAADIHNVGTFVQIYRLTRGVGSAKPPNPLITPEPEDSDSVSSDDSNSDRNSAASVLLLAHRRVDLISLDELGPPIDATVKHWERVEYSGSDDTIRALSNEILSTIREVAQSNALFRESVQFFPTKIDPNDPFRLADFAASIASSGTPEDLQAVLEEKDPEIRLSKALVLLSREREVSKLQQEISSKVEEKLTDAQRKYFLTEQLKAIKKELGMEKDDKEALISKFRKQLAKYPSIPTEAMETIEAEMEVRFYFFSSFSNFVHNNSSFTISKFVR